MKKCMKKADVQKIEKAEYELIEELIELRYKANLSQPKLAKIIGVNQPAIAKIEKHHSSPNVFTFLRLLLPFNKTIKIVDIKK